MPVASETYKYIFFCAPLTGSTSVSRTLVDQADGFWVPEQDLRGEDGKVLVDRKHGSLDELERYELYPSEKLKSFYKFMGVRNPFDRVVSEYTKVRKLAQMDDPPGFFNPKGRHARIAMGNEFPQYVRKRFGKRRKYRFWAYRRKPVSRATLYLNEMKRFVRTEHLEEDFNLVAKDLGLPEGIQIYDINVNRGERGREYRDYYDKKSRFLVERVFREYLDAFGYEF